MNLKYLVTGTGRCGTVYMARILTSIGIPCGHETIFDYRGTRGARKRLFGEEQLRLSFVACAINNQIDATRVALEFRLHKKFFLKTLEPKFMPESWNVERRIYHSNE